MTGDRYYAPGGEPPTDRDREILAEWRARPMTGDYMQWVRDGARITAGYAAGGGARATGRVIAYTDRPTITIVTDDGEYITWIADLCEASELNGSDQ